MENESQNQESKHIARYRPPGWEKLVQDLLSAVREDAQKAGIITKDQQDLMMGEAFADAMLEALRNINGCPAIVIKNRVHIMVTDKSGNAHPVGTQLTYTGDLSFTGPGRLSFIPDDPLAAQIDAIRRAN